MKVIWKPIKGYEGIYEVSNYAEVRNIQRSRKLKIFDRGNGYLCTGLNKNGKQTLRPIHQLVAEAFCMNHFKGAHVNHIDENKTNNLPWNLEWLTQRENTLYSQEKIQAASKIGLAHKKALEINKNL